MNVRLDAGWPLVPRGEKQGEGSWALLDVALEWKRQFEAKGWGT
jgi:hypothetical protein